jgi:hypothetical protein
MGKAIEKAKMLIADDRSSVEQAGGRLPTNEKQSKDVRKKDATTQTTAPS